MVKLKYLQNVATLKLNREKCVGCGMCLNVCPHGVFELTKGKAQVVNLDNCMECGACLKNCAFSAITVSPGVGCASAIIKGFLTGSEPSCDCSGGESC
ncbi:4Fe-4S dicluster domain-containing protein [Anaerocolumna jejuensis DSM 15929]|uniref:4Fe-4S dicluster domain-containing protein n=1 Tax=Anaerocolumna jejuensis DSM 15929 TaxID=1121322 RepID=A0A1M6W1R1_9FIRM|nr:4Fe-4S dicluster domain-containing protein [Anaerocolumna jejuensis DSM 15929]